METKQRSHRRLSDFEATSVAEAERLCRCYVAAYSATFTFTAWVEPSLQDTFNT